MSSLGHHEGDVKSVLALAGFAGTSDLLYIHHLFGILLCLLETLFLFVSSSEESSFALAIQSIYIYISPNWQTD